MLFLDEPTTGLDLLSRNELWDMIRELVDEGTTVLLTTQYLEEADKLAERIAVVDHGHVIADDRPSVLKAQLGEHRRGARLRGGGGATRAVSLLARPTTAPSGTGPRSPDHERRPRVLIDVLRELDHADLSPATLAVHEPSLDDVFLALTGHRPRARRRRGTRRRAGGAGGEGRHERDRRRRRRLANAPRWSGRSATRGGDVAQPDPLPAGSRSCSSSRRSSR